MSIEDGLTYRHKAYANSMKAWRQANPDWKEQLLANEEYAKKWMERSARAYQIAQEKLAKNEFGSTMTDRAKQLREVARQALYSTPNDQECEVPIMVATLRKLNDIFDEEGYGGDEPCCCVFRDIVDIINELEALK